jgi:hypothetical protein
MREEVRLYHSVPKSRLADVLEGGTKAQSAFSDLGLEMRREVVYCWIRREDDKMSTGGQRDDYVYLEVTVSADRCIVADMDLAGLAMMYRDGTGGKPKNGDAARHLAEAYRASAVPLAEYAPGMFFTPEVLVKGDIARECIRVISGGGSTDT